MTHCFALLGLLLAAPPEVAVLPTPAETVEPTLPADALAPGEDRTVILHAHVDKEGKVKHVEVHAGAGAPFDQAAIDAVAQWLFFPAEDINGAPMDVTAEIPIHFHRPVEVHPEETTEHVAPTHGHAHEAAATLAPVEDIAPAPPAAPAPPVEDSLFTVVQDRSPPAPPAAVSDFDIEVGQLADVPRKSATDLMSLAPGVLLVNHGGEGHAPTIFLRGFDAGEGKDVEFLLDGIPLNEPSSAHGHGYADSYFIIPELVDNLRVVEGPFDPAQGDFAIAGTTEFRLGLKERGLSTNLSYGMFNSVRLAGTFGPPGLSNRTFAGVLFRSGDGYGTNRSYMNGTAMGQYEGRLVSDVRVRALGAVTAGRFNSAGVLRQDDFLARRLPCADDEFSQFFCTYDTTQGGSTQRALGLLEARLKLGPGRFSQSGYATYKNTHLRENFTGFVTDIRDGGAPQRGDGLDLGTQGFTLGGNSLYVIPHKLLGAKARTEVGLSARHDHLLTQGQRLRYRSIIPYKTAFSNLVDVSNLSTHGTFRLRPFSFLRLMAGARAALFVYGFTDQNRPDNDRDGFRLPVQSSEAFGATIMPRASATLEVLPGLSLSAAGGLGARSSDGAALSDGEAAPFANVFSAEVGARYELVRGTMIANSYSLIVRGAAYYTFVGQDLVFDPEQGRNATVGRSNRMGAYGQARYTWANFLDLNTSVAYSEAFLPGPDDPLYNVIAGPRVPYVPRLMSRTDLSLRERFLIFGQEVRVAGAIGATLVAPKPLPLETFSDPILVADSSLTVGWRWFDLGVVAENLLDARYRQQEFNYMSSFDGPDAFPSLIPERHFAAGAPRLIRATLTVHLETLDDLSW